MPLAAGHIREGAPYPVLVNVLNADPEFSGAIECRLGDPHQAGTVMQFIHVGKGLFRYPLYPYAATWRNADLSVDLFNNEPRVLSTTTVPIQSAPEGGWVAVVQAHRRLIKPLDLGDPDLTMIELTSLTRLPGQWYGYELFEAVCWDGRNDDTLAPGQRQALADWVAAGGRLLLVAQPGDPTLTSPLPDLMPSLAFDAALPPREAFAATCRNAAANTPGRANAVHFAHGRLERRHGLGAIVAVQADPAATGTTAPLRRALAPWVPANPLEEMRSVDRYHPCASWWLSQTLRKSAGYSRQDFLPVFLLLALYIGLVSLGDYRLLKRFNRLPWTWATFPAVILLFAVLVPVCFYQGQPSMLRRHDIRFEDRGLDGYGRAWTMSTIRKPVTKPVSFPIQAGHFVHDISAWDRDSGSQGGGAARDGLTLVTDATGTLARISGPIGSYQFFGEEWPLAPAAGAPAGRLTVEDGHLTGTLSAPPGPEFDCACLLYGSNLHAVAVSGSQLLIHSPIQDAAPPNAMEFEGFRAEAPGDYFVTQWLQRSALAAARTRTGRPAVNTFLARSDDIIRATHGRPDLAVLFTIRKTADETSSPPATRWLCTRQILPVELTQGSRP